MMKLMRVMFLVLVPGVGACGNSSLPGSVEAFKTATAQIKASSSEHFAQAETLSQEAFFADLAVNERALSLSAECATLGLVPSALENCVVRASGVGNLELPFDRATFVLLATGLDEFAASLHLLASDPSNDLTAFKNQVNATAGKAAALVNATKAGGGQANEAGKALGSIGGIVAEAGAVTLKVQRD